MRLLIALMPLSCLAGHVQPTKHIQNQPGDLNAVFALKMLNPASMEWSWLCRNLQLRTRSYLQVSAGALVPNFTPAAAASVQAGVREQLDAAPRTLSSACVPFLAVSGSGSSSANRVVEHIDFKWNTLHLADPVSGPLLATARNRLLAGSTESESKKRSKKKSTAAAAPGAGTAPAASPGSLGGVGGGRPPTGRAGRGSGIAGRRKRQPMAGAGEAGGPVGVAKSRSTARTLRSPLVQANMKKAHEAVVSALMEEDQRATVAKPSYLVQRVLPNLLWPDGGVVIYAQFPFLLDLSWKRCGAWSAICNKSACAPDGDSAGGTYEVFFTLQDDPGSGSEDGTGEIVDLVDDFDRTSADVADGVDGAAGRGSGSGGTNESSATDEGGSRSSSGSGPAAGGSTAGGVSGGAADSGAGGDPVAGGSAAGGGRGGSADDGAGGSPAAGRTRGTSETERFGGGFSGAGGTALDGGAAPPAEVVRDTEAPVSAGPTSPGLHILLKQAIRDSNEDLGLGPDGRAEVQTITQSPASSFLMNCSFYTDMDLDTTDPDHLSCQTDSFITAAYRARPRILPPVRRVRQ